VDFSYDGSRRDLTGIKARIPKGTYVAFVGPSGSGKSTMLNLLMRFQVPDAGFIAIDGHDLKSVKQASLRARIGVVLQENSIFNIPVRENIRLGKPEASEEAIINAAKAAGLHEFIASLPLGYGAVAGEHGVQFSSAQRQRMAIARAMLRDPEILLLDEATSGLDPLDETDVNATLRKLAKGRTVISVTHRLATAADADHIFVFDEGRIVEQGSHFELLGVNGTYADLWRKQAGFTFSQDGRHVDVDARRLKAFPILESLDEEKLAELAPFFATETFQPGREIVRQNDPGDKFYIIARGKVEVWRAEEQSGNTQRMAILQDGDFFGEITLITGFPRTATVRTLTVCTCISLERGQFNRMIERSPELRRHMSEVAVQRLRQSSRAVFTTR
jgi:ATP-binding cassette, subfamily B, bacterial